MKLNCLDYVNISEHFSEDELMVQHATREFVDKEIIPNIDEHFENATFPKELISKFGELGYLGMKLHEKYGCAGRTNVGYGLM